MLAQPAPTSAAIGTDSQRLGASPKPAMPTRHQQRPSAGSPASARRARPAGRRRGASAPWRARRPRRSTAVAKGLAPTCSRRSSADHSIIAPSISSAPIGTRHISSSASEGRREARLGCGSGAGSSAISRRAKKTVAAAKIGCRISCCVRKPMSAWAKAPPISAPGDGAEAPEGVAAGHDPPPEHPLGLARLGVHRHLDRGDGQPADEEARARAAPRSGRAPAR